MCIPRVWGCEAPTVTPALMNDHLTGYLLAIGVVAALAEREAHGGFWRVATSLSRCSMMGTELLGPVDAERYAPITEQDLIDHAVDQVSPWGTFTRFAPPVAFSHTPSMALRPTSWPGTDPDTIGWTANPPAPRHRSCRTIRRSWRARGASAISYPISASRIAAMAAGSSASPPSRRR